MDIRVKLFKSNGSSIVKANGSVVFDDVFAVQGVHVCEGENGLFVSMPRRKNRDDKYVDIAFPITSEFRKTLHEAVLEEYSRLMAEEGGETAAAEQ